MQLKGLVKFFTVVLVLISLYQLSFTYFVRNVEKKAHAKAASQAKGMKPDATERELADLTQERYLAITDSMQGKKVVNMLFKKYSYLEAKNNELKLGLDLQGGMNVTLDVSLDDLVRAMSNNPDDAALNQAIKTASDQKLASQESFVSLFEKAWPKDKQLAYLFTKPGTTEITLQSTNKEIFEKIRAQADDAINSTYRILQERIDRFGVSQPTINLDRNRGVITVELAGVQNPERVRDNLQATARLQFWEMYQIDQAFAEALKRADLALQAKLGGITVKDTLVKTDTLTASTNAADTGISILDRLAGEGGSTAAGITDSSKMNPLMRLLMFNDNSQRDPAIAYIPRANIVKFNDYLNTDVVKNILPTNAKFLIGAENAQTREQDNPFLPVYVVKTVPGGTTAKLEGDLIEDAGVSTDPANGKVLVTMRMNNEGSRIWKKMTEDNLQRSVAVSLDDRVYSAPTVQSVIDGGNTQISGNFTAEEARDLANILKVGKLPAPAHIVQEQVVGPTLGAENIAAGMKSLIIAFIAIFLLMMVYYNTSGIVANIALIMNVLVTFGMLAMFGATLTMPAIAGLVLTIGMAVDTNVIVFERIKEELSLGKSYHQAVADGYKRSYAPVLDGHTTQFITAAILFYFGLGPVKGFATTQMIGLVLSVFCGLMVSRVITDMWTKRERHFKYFTALSNSIFKKAHFKFIEVRKVTYIISCVIFALGVASYFYGFDKGVEFSGGRSYNIQFDQAHTVNDVKDKLAKHLDGERPIVKTIGSNNVLNITTTYHITDTRKEASALVQEQLYNALKAENLIPASVTFPEFSKSNKYLQSEQTVTPTISESLKKDAVKAMVLSLLAIFLYILIRFRKWQYSLGTIISLLHDVCVTMALFSFLRGHVPFPLELDQHFIAAILTVVGFSMNDTIIVFDRVREYFRKNTGESKSTIINRAINDTLSRTVMTSVTLFIAVLILFIFGGEALKGFSFAMMIGVVAGTYSSIFVAAPILIDLDRKDKLKNEVDREAQIEELKKLA